MSSPGQSRREFVKKVAYVAPVVLTLETIPAHARAGSGSPSSWDDDDDDDRKYRRRRRDDDDDDDDDDD